MPFPSKIHHPIRTLQTLLSVVIVAFAAGCGQKDRASAPQINTASLYAVPSRGPDPTPIAVANQRDFNFGFVEPLIPHHHTFEIRNLGKVALKLSSPNATCKCLHVESVTDVIPPGGVGSVVISWTPKAARDEFKQNASIKTNDPLHETLEFKITGRSLLLLATNPPELIASRVKPEQSAEIAGMIFSQVLDEFSVADMTTSLDGLKWKLTPAKSEQLAALGAKSGWNVLLTVPNNLPQGPFTHWLRFKAEPKHLAKQIDDELLDYTVPVRGYVIRRISVFGDGLDFDGTLDLDIVKPGIGLERVLTVRVQDEVKDLKVASIEAQPDFIEAHLEPFTGKNTSGLYRLRLRIPPDAKPGYYRGDDAGKVRLSFDHPRIDSLELRLTFVVPNEKPTRLTQISQLDVSNISHVSDFAERSP